MEQLNEGYCSDGVSAGVSNSTGLAQANRPTGDKGMALQPAIQRRAGKHQTGGSEDPT